jgi:beta-xylosidase
MGDSKKRSFRLSAFLASLGAVGVGAGFATAPLPASAETTPTAASLMHPTPSVSRAAPFVSKVWVADQGDGTYKNPILYADYSDPDVIRVGRDFYMTASSFNAVPGLPVLHSKDLVNWTLIGHAIERQPPFDFYSRPQHGKGVWAPAIRYHHGEFYIFYPDPDFGIYLVKAKSPTGPWSEPLLVKAAKGWIDPCPLWDVDGKAYLIHAMARSRGGINGILVVNRMSADGTRLLDDGELVFDGGTLNPTVEGPKLYRTKDYYYIFAPAGGVEQGWQLVLRSTSIYGPYESRVVLNQGRTAINGPHQGAWVDTPSGESWFIHFQDQGALGRVVHLQPITWRNGWPLIGADPGSGIGEPVMRHRKPATGAAQPMSTPPDSDEFNVSTLGLQWQWQANPDTNWALPSAAYGFLRLYTVPLPAHFVNFWELPNLLLQKFPSPLFTATVKVSFTPLADDEETGLVVMGSNYAYLSLRKRPDGLYISQTVDMDAERGAPETKPVATRVDGSTFYLRVAVTADALTRFSFSSDGLRFTPIGEPFTAKRGTWIGAKVGLFANRPTDSKIAGYADVDWFRVE